jgi:ABC-type lipoprotein release transport system permease subunit
MIWAKLIFGGFGKRGLEAAVAALLLGVAGAIVAASLMVVEGARSALAQSEHADRADVIQVKSRFNRALFETPRSGNLPPLTLPVYEPLIDPEILESSLEGATVVPRQSLLRNTVAGESFLNVYIFGIDPDKERLISTFSLLAGRWLRNDDLDAVILDGASARALGVKLGGTFPVRKADGRDLQLVVVGLIDRLELWAPPPRTVDAPVGVTGSSFVSSGAFVTLRTSEEIFDRTTLTDALVVVPTPADVPPLANAIREGFRLEPGVFVTERYTQYKRKVRDFASTLELFATISAVTAIVAVSFGANLLQDALAERRRQYATLFSIGFSPAQAMMAGLSLALAVACSGIAIGSAAAIAFAPKRFSMPSLMADLGTIKPEFDAVVAGVLAAMAAAAIVLGIIRTVWRLWRHSLASNLVED